MLFTPRYARPLTEEVLNELLPWRGVYALFEHGELVLFGQAVRVDVRDRLRVHAARVAPATRLAMQFTVEKAHDPAALLEVRLAKYQREFGHLPRLNRCFVARA